MKVDFELVEKTFTPENGNPIKYYVLQRILADGSIFELPIKGDKSKLLFMSLSIENKNQIK